MTRVDIYLNINKEWHLDLETMIEHFPDEYKKDKEEGLTDEEFVRRTFDEMGEFYWEEIFGYGQEDSEISFEVY